MIETPAQILEHYATRSAVLSFCAWRKKIKKPLTETAALRIASTLSAIVEAGGDASDALGMCEEMGWQSIKKEWYFGKRTGNQAANIATDATSRRIAFAATASRSPGKDCF
jgi:hypothetical protein